MKMKERLTSWAVWVSVLGAVGVVLNSFGLFQRWGIDSESWNIIVNAIGSLLIAFGILNNPTNKEGF